MEDLFPWQLCSKPGSASVQRQYHIIQLQYVQQTVLFLTCERKLLECSFLSIPQFNLYKLLSSAVKHQRFDLGFNNGNVGNASLLSLIRVRNVWTRETKTLPECWTK